MSDEKTLLEVLDTQGVEAFLKLIGMTNNATASKIARLVACDAYDFVMALYAKEFPEHAKVEPVSELILAARMFARGELSEEDLQTTLHRVQTELHRLPATMPPLPTIWAAWPKMSAATVLIAALNEHFMWLSYLGLPKPSADSMIRKHLAPEPVSCPFKVGDIVRMKSSGPAMTFAGLNEAGQAFCRWFSCGELDNATFGIAELMPVSHGIEVIDEGCGTDTIPAGCHCGVMRK